MLVSVNNSNLNILYDCSQNYKYILSKRVWNCEKCEKYYKFEFNNKLKDNLKILINLVLDIFMNLYDKLSFNFSLTSNL